MLENFDTVGEYLRYLRIEAGLKQSDVEKKLNLTPKHVSKWENNRVGIRKDNAKKLSKLFNVGSKNFTNFENAKREEREQKRRKEENFHKPNETLKREKLNSLDRQLDQIESVAAEQGVSGSDLEIVLEYLQGRAESLSKEMKEMAVLLRNIQKNRNE
jgi:transcriptional regulator with XRE-family HTH domain